MADIDSHSTASACHEAAHAVIRYGTAAPATWAGSPTIIRVPEWEKLGHIRDVWRDSFNREHMEAKLLSGYAGGHAQRRYDPALGDSGCSFDEEQTAALLRNAAGRTPNRSSGTDRWRWSSSTGRKSKQSPKSLLERSLLNETEVEFMADIAAGSSKITPAVPARYRRDRPPLSGARSPSSDTQ